MASTLNADNGAISGSSGLKSSADASGVLALQTNGTTALSISTAQAITINNDVVINGLTVGKGGGNVSVNASFGQSALILNTSGTNNSAFGNLALTANTTGSNNTGIGFWGLVSNTTGSYNTALGTSALASNTTASYNTAVGYQAGYSNTTGTSNNAIGYQALYANTGSANNAMGESALKNNTSGSANTAIGQTALFSSTTASNNTAVGYQALYSSTTANQNNAFGKAAAYNITTGMSNNVFGCNAAYYLTTGWGNVCIGDGSGYNLTTGNGNTFVGTGDPRSYYPSGYYITTGNYNTIIGAYNGNQGGLDIRTSNNYIVLSDGAGNPRAYWNSNGSMNTSSTIGSAITATTNDTTGIAFSGAANSTSFTGNVVDFECARNTNNGSYSLIAAARLGVAYVFRVYDSGNVVNTNNSYGAISDIKLKENIEDASPKLEDLCKVKIRNYNLKEFNTHKQIGVIAQELETVFPSMVEEIVDRDKEGNDLGTTTKQVKYSVFVPMLIKAVQELKAEVDSLKAQLNK